MTIYKNVRNEEIAKKYIFIRLDLCVKNSGRVEYVNKRFEFINGQVKAVLNVPQKEMG